MEIGLLAIPFFLLVIIAIRFFAGMLDHDRIREYIEQNGGQVISSNWELFGPGWFGEKSDRIYFVKYRDKDGNEHEAYCKTSLLTGVYFTEDQIVSYAATKLDEESKSVESLVAENQRLREEVERLRRG